MFDFCSKVDLRLNNKRVLENLVKSGAFDSLGSFRSQQYSSIDRAIEEAQQKQKDEAIGRIALFGDNVVVRENSNLLPDIPAWPESERLAYEKESLGFYLTGNPLEKYREEIKDFATADASNLAEGSDKRRESVAGLISAVSEKIAKNGSRMAFITLEDLRGSIEVIAFSDVYESCKTIIAVDTPVLVRGQVDVVENGVEAKIRAEEIRLLDNIRGEEAKSILIVTSAVGLDGDAMHKLNNILEKSKGSKTVNIRLNYPKKYSVKIALNPYIKVNPNPKLIDRIKDVFGKNSVKYEL